MGWWTPRFLFLKKWSPRLQLQASETPSALLRWRLHTRMKKLPRHSRNIPHSPAKSAPQESSFQRARHWNSHRICFVPEQHTLHLTARAASNPRTTRQMRMQGRQGRQTAGTKRMMERRFLGVKRQAAHRPGSIVRAETARPGEENRGRRVCSAHQRHSNSVHAGREDPAKQGPAGVALVFTSSTSKSIHGGREWESTGSAADCWRRHEHERVKPPVFRQARRLPFWCEPSGGGGTTRHAVIHPFLTRPHGHTGCRLCVDGLIGLRPRSTFVAFARCGLRGASSHTGLGRELLNFVSDWRQF